MAEIMWYKIGEGTKLHAFNSDMNKSLCGITGALTGPFALREPHCLRCERNIEILEIIEKEEKIIAEANPQLL